MRLGLSAEAAPAAPAAELVDACVRRGLTTLELGHVPSEGDDALLAGIGVAVDAGLEVCGLLSDAASYANRLSVLSRSAGVPIVLRGTGDLRTRLVFARSIIEHGGSARALVTGPAYGWLAAVMDARIPFAWQIDDTCADPAGDARAILDRTDTLEYVRLVGGGPETALRSEPGIGRLMSMLAMSGYAGPLILTPSSPRYRIAWSAWLGRRGGWGCGNAHGARGPELLTLSR